MFYQDDRPRRQVNIRLEHPIYNFLVGEAKHNNMTPTQLLRHYFIKGFNVGYDKNRYNLVIDKARRRQHGQD